MSRFADPEPVMKKIPLINFMCFDAEIDYKTKSYIHGKKPLERHRDNYYHCSRLRSAVFDLLNNKESNATYFKEDTILGDNWNLKYHTKELLKELPKEERIEAYLQLKEEIGKEILGNKRCK